jgi:hypothetical protein
MKKLFFILFFTICFNSYSQNISVDALRREYNQVNTDSATCAKLYKKMIRSSNADNITTAYRGAITAAMANFPKDKKEKLELFKTGKKLLEQSITADSSNIETRFLRFTIQTNCPKALGYNKQIASDKTFILKNYSTTTNTAVKNMISSFAEKTTYFTEAEKQKLK